MDHRFAGNSPYVTTVGAVETAQTASRGDDSITSYSSKGPTAIHHIVKPDLVAPGNRLAATEMAPAGLASLSPK